MKQALELSVDKMSALKKTHYVQQIVFKRRTLLAGPVQEEKQKILVACQANVLN